MRFLYTLLLYLAVPFLMLRLFWRSRRVKGYRKRWYERFGYIPKVQEGSSIWVHAVSVGETIAAIPLIQALLKHYPQHPIVVTTTTPTGSEQVLKHFKNKVHHTYAPYDLPSAVNRFLKRAKPTLCIIMETELWPNMLHCTQAHKIPILLANARLSEHSFRGYRKIASLTQEMLSKITLVAAQSNADGDRFVSLGLNPEKLIITGNIKFDLELPETLFNDGQNLRSYWESRPTLIAASTHEGEETIILNAFKFILQKFPNALLILAPRHPDRFQSVAKLCHTLGFSIAKRSKKELPDKKTNILLGDTLGELRLLYTASDIAFVGGSLVPIGGHNLIEPAAVKLPILTGNHLHNFVLVSHLLKEADALITVNDAESLATQVTQLLTDSSLRQAIGQRAYKVSQANTGALKKHMEFIEQLSF